MAMMNITDLPKRQSAFCTACKADVMVMPDLACPRCGDMVDPLSLPRVPGAETRPTVLLATVPERQAVQPETTRTAEIVKPAAVTEQTRVTLPRMDNVVQWHVDTQRLHASLEEIEAELVANLRGVRQMRKLLGTTLGLIESPKTTNDSPSPDAPVPEPETIVAPQVTIATEVLEAPWPPAVELAPETPRAVGRFALGPEHPDYVPPATNDDSKPWSTGFPYCVDCGKTDRPYMAKGRCRGCYGPWIKAGRP